MNVESFVLEAGDGQLILVYMNEDIGQTPDPVLFMAEVARDAADQLAEGWRLMSIATWPAHQQPALLGHGHYITQLAAVATYTKAA